MFIFEFFFKSGFLSTFNKLRTYFVYVFNEVQRVVNLRKLTI